MQYEPSYIKLYKNGELTNRVEKALSHLTACNLCPHHCNVNRKEALGFCRAQDKAVISDYGPHFGEESVLVGRRGSGTIFFGYCNMKCVFCQNCKLSFGGEGRIISNEDLAQIMLTLQNNYRCHNINLVTPTHFVPNILDALAQAVEAGLQIPLVYNCGGYEEIETIKLLEGVIDIYMPDFKYNIAEWGEKYSQVKDYSSKVQGALKEMDQQVGGLKVSNGLAYRGLLIRHLIMPGGLDNTKEVLRFIKNNLSKDCLVNLMDQYYPAHKAFEYAELSRRITSTEYREALSFARELGLNLAE